MAKIKQVEFYGVIGEGPTLTDAKHDAQAKLATIARTAERAPGVILLSGGTVFVIATAYRAGSYDIHHIPGRGYPSASSVESTDPMLAGLSAVDVAAFKACAHALQYAPEETVVGCSAIPETIQAAAAFEGAAYQLERERFEQEAAAKRDAGRFAPGPFFQGKPWQVTGGGA